MKKDAVLKEVFSTKWWFWLVGPMLVAFFVGQAAMYSRSITIREVRDVGIEFTAALIEAALAENKDDSKLAKLNRVFNALAKRESPETHLGTAIWVQGQQKEQNHAMLEGKSVEAVHKLIVDGDIRYSLRELRPDGHEHPLHLAFFRPELAHDMGVGHFLWLSFFQLFDEHSIEVTGQVFVEKLWRLWLWSAALTLLVIFLIRYAFCYHYQKIAAKLKYARKAAVDLEEKRDRNQRELDEAKQYLEKEEGVREKLREDYERQQALVAKANKQQKKADYELQRSRERLQELERYKREFEEQSAQVQRLKEQADLHALEAEEIQQQQMEVQAQIESFERRSLKSRDTLSAKVNLSKLGKKDWRLFLTSAFPGFHFKPDSFDAIAKVTASSQYKDNLELVVKYLARLHNDRDKVQSKRVRGGCEAREIRLSGSGRGHYPLRIYYCDDGDQVFVLVGEKSHQADDIRYLQVHYKSRK